MAISIPADSITNQNALSPRRVLDYNPIDSNIDFVGSFERVQRHPNSVYLVESDYIASRLIGCGYSAVNIFKAPLTKYPKNTLTKTGVILVGDNADDRDWGYRTAVNLQANSGHSDDFGCFLNVKVSVSRGVTQMVRLISPSQIDAEIVETVNNLQCVWDCNWSFDESAPNRGPFEIDNRVAGDLLTENRTSADRFIWDETIITKGVALLTGLPGHGKTRLAQSLVAAISNGSPFLGRDTVQRKCLFLGFQGDSYELDLQMVAAGINRQFVDVHYSEKPRTFAEFREAITRYIVANNPGMIVIDMMQQAFCSSDINSYVEMDGPLNTLARIAQRLNTAFVCLHHDNKNGTTNGSVAIEGSVELVLHVEKLRNGSHVLSSRKPRYGKSFEKENIDLVDGRIVRKDAPSQLVSVEAAVLGLLKESSLKGPELRKRLKVGNASAKIALDTLVSKGKILVKGAGRKGDPIIYSLA